VARADLCGAEEAGVIDIAVGWFALVAIIYPAMLGEIAAKIVYGYRVRMRLLEDR
jgi:hypothetical protein